MSEIERFLGGKTDRTLRLRDGLALSRQLSTDNAEAVRQRNQEANRHRNALARQAETKTRGEAAVDHTVNLIEHARAAAGGDPYTAEQVLESVRIALRRINDQI